MKEYVKLTYLPAGAKRRRSAWVRVVRRGPRLTIYREVTREGDDISAQGSGKDDRVMSIAMGVRCWEERARRGLINAKRTRSSEEAKRRLTIVDQVQMYNQGQFEQFLAGKSAGRRQAALASMRRSWRGR